MNRIRYLEKKNNSFKFDEDFKWKLHAFMKLTEPQWRKTMQIYVNL